MSEFDDNSGPPPNDRNNEVANTGGPVADVEDDYHIDNNERPGAVMPATGLQNGGDGDDSTNTESDDETNSGEDSRFDEENPEGDYAENVSDGQGKKDVKVEDDEEKESRWKKFALAGGVCLAFLILVIVLAILFTPNAGSARAVGVIETESPTTPSPTANPTTPSPTANPTTPSPTQSPSTPAPTDSNPTPNPVAAPTPEPTTGPPTSVIISRLPCQEIQQTESVTEGNKAGDNFKNYSILVEGQEENVTICGDTWGGVDPDRPNRNQWTVSLGRRDCPTFDYDGVKDKCDSLAGARLCTLNEFNSGAALGTGCGGDRVFVYTSTDCVHEDGPVGKVMFDLGLRDPKKPFTECQTNLSTPSIIRCCGDYY